MKHISTCVFVLLVAVTIAQNREKAFEINAKLGRGINYGNMFEAPSEQAWGNPWKPEYARMIAELGFNHVRIPIRWEPAARSSDTPPYAIKEIFLNRVKQVVDSALNNGMMAIINMHHHEALYEDPEGQKERFLAQWEQISTFFKDYPDDLLFELLNEPHGNLTPEKWNDLAREGLAKVRKENPERIVLIGTAEYGGLGGLSSLQIPEDEYIILTVHYYNPFQFTHQGASWAGDNSNDWLGTEWHDSETERNVMRQDFAPLAAISEMENIPVHIGEFGAYSRADIKSRTKWTTFLSRYFEELNWSWAYWEFSAGFGIYDPEIKRYNRELVDALLINEMPEPAHYAGTPVYTSNFQMSNDGWSFQIHQGSASMSRNNDMLRVNISNGGTAGWHIQLMRTGISLEAVKKYRVSFMAKADTKRSATTYVGMNRDPWSAYSGYNGISLTDTFAVYTFVFDMQTTDSNARMVFDIGNTTTNFEIKDIKLEEIVLVPPTLAKIEKKFNTVVYPNPVHNKLYINNLDNFTSVSVFNLQGKKIISALLHNHLNVINLENLRQGLYYITLNGKNSKHSTRVLKK